MAEMGIGMLAPHFGALHEKATVFLFNDIPGSRGLVKLGHPVPESNLSRELNRGSPETIST